MKPFERDKDKVAMESVLEKVVNDGKQECLGADISHAKPSQVVSYKIQTAYGRSYIGMWWQQRDHRRNYREVPTTLSLSLVVSLEDNQWTTKTWVDRLRNLAHIDRLEETMRGRWRRDETKIFRG